MDDLPASVIGGLVRHGLTAAGGALVAKGIIASTTVDPVVGAIMTIIGVLWSIYQKRKAAA